MVKSLDPQRPGQKFKSAKGAGGMDERKGNDLEHLPRTHNVVLKGLPLFLGKEIAERDKWSFRKWILLLTGGNQ